MRRVLSVCLGTLLASLALAAVAVQVSTRADCTQAPQEPPPEARSVSLGRVHADLTATSTACGD